MTKHKKKLIFLAVTAVAAFYLFWPGFEPDLGDPPALYLDHSASYGTNTGAGNVVGIEPYMQPLDYATPERFERKLAGYLDAARDKGWIGDDTIVLLPEHIGTWLLATGQNNRVYNAATTSGAMLPIISHNLLQFLKNFFIFDEEEAATAALIRTRTQVSADAQLRVFANLAREYRVTLVAGSSALMTPGVYADSLSYGHGPIFNAGFVFGPDGKPQNDAIRKVHPIPAEVGFTTASKAEFLPVFNPGAQTFGVLICADSWFDDTSGFLTKEGANLLLVPGFLTDTKWDAPWQGYSVDAPPSGVWQADVGKITEGEAWIKYALPAKAKAYGVRFGMTVFLKGNLWGEAGAGHALIIEDGSLHVGKAGDTGAALYNLWLK